MDEENKDSTQEQENQDDFQNFFDYDQDSDSEDSKKEEPVNKEPDQEKTPSSAGVDKEEFESFKREQRVTEFLNNPDNQDYKEYSDKIKEIAGSPMAKGLTVEAIANMVVPKDFWLKKGAELERQAAQESSQSFTTGGGRTTPPKDGGDVPNAWDLDSKDFEKEAWKLARGD